MSLRAPMASAREWKRLGIHTAFVCTALAESGTFVPAARQAGFRPIAGEGQAELVARRVR